MRIRVRSSTGVSNLTADPAWSIADLKTAVGGSKQPTDQFIRFQFCTTLPEPLITVLCGFPPKPLTGTDTENITKYISQGDTIVVQASAQTAHDSRPPQPAASSSIPSARPTSASGRRVVVKEVPDDNSCLFRSVNGILGSPNDSVRPMRLIVANEIRANPLLYNEAFLGRSGASYAQWILTDNAWGGAIELSILSQHYKVELAAFDVKTMRLDRYGEGAGYSKIGFLVYDGIHYNYVALPSAINGLSRSDTTQFNTSDIQILSKVRDLVQKAHNDKKFTDTASFTLKCGQCGTKLRGEANALEHAKATGHSNFEEN